MAVFGTANIKSNPLMSIPHVTHDITIVVTRLHDGVIGFQEIGPASYKKALLGVLKQYGWEVFGEDTECPVAWDATKYELYPNALVSPGKHMMHGGLSHVSPTRYYVAVPLRIKGTAEVFVFVNTHYVSGAWAKAYRTFKDWRLKAWNKSWAAENEFVDSLVESGFAVVLTGDFNKGSVAKFDDAQVDLIDGTGGIIHLAIIPGRYVKSEPYGEVITIEGTQSKRPELYTDHAVKARKVRLTRVAG